MTNPVQVQLKLVGGRMSDKEVSTYLALVPRMNDTLLVGNELYEVRRIVIAVPYQCSPPQVLAEYVGLAS